MSRKPKFKPQITRVKLNPEQAVLACTCYNTGKRGAGFVFTVWQAVFGWDACYTRNKYAGYRFIGTWQGGHETARCSGSSVSS